MYRVRGWAGSRVWVMEATGQTGAQPVAAFFHGAVTSGPASIFKLVLPISPDNLSAWIFSPWLPGVSKCGTTDLYHRLIMHKGILAARNKVWRSGAKDLGTESLNLHHVNSHIHTETVPC